MIYRVIYFALFGSKQDLSFINKLFPATVNIVFIYLRSQEIVDAMVESIVFRKLAWQTKIPPENDYW